MNWLVTLVFSALAFSTDVPLATTRTAVVNSDSYAVMHPTVDETERFEQVYPFTANGRVAVCNVNGSITVEAWDRSEIKLEYTKTGDTKERLADVTVNIDAKADSFSVEAKYDEWKSRADRQTRNNSSKLVVDFKLTVPRGAVLDEIGTVNGSVLVSNFTNRTKVSAVNGSVTAANLRGSAELETVNGQVVSEFETLGAAENISLSTVNGNVKLVLPSDANATVRADSLNGMITNDFNLPIRKGKYVGRDLHARLGEGGASIKLESVNGALSIARRNDGRNLSPVTNLLTSKPGEDESGFFHGPKIDRETQKAMREAQRAAQKEISLLQPEIARVAAQAAKQATAVVKMTDMQKEIETSIRAKGVAMAALANLDFGGGVPQIKKKSNSFPVKGVPTVNISALGCNVIVRGWDKSEVAYQVTQFSDPRSEANISMNESQTETSVTLNLENHAYEARGGNFHDNARHMRIEVNVPKKSNLKIASNGEIRLEGVSGEIELIGEDDVINIRESEGKLKVSNGDGIVRIIGFTGGLVANTADGSVFMDGDFANITATGGGGEFVLTVPKNIDADLFTSGSVGSFRIENIANGKEVSKNIWRFGKGGRSYQFKMIDGSLRIQNRDREQ